MAGVQGSALAVAVSNAGRPRLAPLRHAQPRRPARTNWRRSGPGRRSRSTSTSSATRRPRPIRSARRPGGPRWRPTTTSSGIDAGRDRRRAGARAVQRRGRRRARRVPPAVVSFHFGLPSPELLARVQALGREGPLLGDHGGGGALAGGARRRRDHRAGSRGGRASRHVPVGRPDDAGRHVGAAAADRRRR